MRCGCGCGAADCARLLVDRDLEAVEEGDRVLVVPPVQETVVAHLEDLLRKVIAPVASRKAQLLPEDALALEVPHVRVDGHEDSGRLLPGALRGEQRNRAHRTSATNRTGDASRRRGTNLTDEQVQVINVDHVIGNCRSPRAPVSGVARSQGPCGGGWGRRTVGQVEDTLDGAHALDR